MAIQVSRLTGGILKKLSSGACRLLLAYKEEPEASVTRCMELTGYSRRWIKTLRQELQQAGAIADGETAGGSADKPVDEPEQAYQVLVAFGVKPVIARDLAQQHAWEAIQESIQYVRSRPGIANPAGYLVKRLRERSGLRERAPEVVTVEQPAAVIGSESVYEKPSPCRPSPSGGGTIPGICALLPEGEGLGLRAVDPFRTPSETPVPMEVVASGAPAALTPAVKMTILSTENGLPNNPEWQMLAYSVTVACGCDLNLNPASVQAVNRLYAAGYNAEDVGYFLKAYWPTIWPGSSGEPPTLAALLAHIGHAKHLLDMAAGRSRGEELLRRVDLLRQHQAGACALEHPDDLLPLCEGDPDLSPYATSGHPRFKGWVETEHQAYLEEGQQQRADSLAANCPTCRRSREACICAQVAAIPGRIKDTWVAVLGQLQIQLNRATYDTWLRHLSLAGYVDGDLVVETPNTYTRDWIERYLLPSMTRAFNDIYRRSPSEAVVRIRLAPKPGEPFTLAHLL